MRQLKVYYLKIFTYIHDQNKFHIPLHVSTLYCIKCMCNVFVLYSIEATHVYIIIHIVKLTSSLGQLSLDVDCDQHSPRKVQVPVDSPQVRACCSVDCSLVITESGQLLAAGNNRCMGVV